MSGTNPFRRNTAQQSSYLPTTIASSHNASEREKERERERERENEREHGDRSEPRIPPIDTDLPRSTKTKTGKTVRIISPHSATSDGQHAIPRTFFSPPPIPPTSPPPELLSPQAIEDDSPEDPFSADSDGAGGNTDDEGTRQNTLRNSGNFQSATGGVGAMPANPFKKTLASLEIESRASPPSPLNTMEAEPKTTRPHYDVDDFKKLLLTGEKSASTANAAVPPPVNFQISAHVGDSSSNTDASSISRGSIFEPLSAPLQESPRTSHESVLSDDERQRLVGSTSMASEKFKPATPRHRHGKLVKPNAPQTVSFEDPTLSFSNSAMNLIAPVDPSTPPIPGNVDKPLPALPPPPNIQPSTQNPTESTNDDMQGPYLESEGPLPGNIVQKRSPPPPPLSRRNSQPRATKHVSSFERSTRITEEGTPKLESEPLSLSQSAPAHSSKGPPPPPPRRAGLIRGNSSSSSLSTGPSFVPLSDQSNAADVSTRSTKSGAAVLPNRSPSVSSVKRPNPIQLNSVSPSVAPLPPPRRRGSSQSSYTPSRFSGHYPERLRSDSGASSTSHLAMTPEDPNRAETKDVMADLSALQREVDALREKFPD